MRSRRPAVVLVALACVASAASACGDGDGKVTIAFRPPVGTELAYVTEVESTTTTDVPCQEPATRVDRTRLDATQRILEPDGPGVRVEVALSRAGIGTRTFVMRFDRAAQLTAVEEVEGIPAAALGDLGLSEIFPAAAGAPPEAPLAPGDRWTIDDEVQLDDGGRLTRLTGEGRLVELGVEDGHDTATVHSTTTLDVETQASATTGTRSLEGEQVSEVEAVYDLDTGALRRAEADTVGRFELTLGPPPGGSGEPCVGRLTLEIRSTVTRAD